MTLKNKPEDQQEGRNGLGDLFAMIPGGILGGIGLVGLLSGVIDLHVQVQSVVGAYQMATRSIWEQSVGQLLGVFGLAMPDLLKDYFTMGIIVSVSELFAISRMLWKSTWRDRFWERVIGIFRVMFMDMHMRPLVSFLFWPVTIFRTFSASLRNTSASDHFEMMTSPLRSLKRGRAFYQTMRHYGAKQFFGFIVWALVIVMVSYGMVIVEGTPQLTE